MLGGAGLAGLGLAAFETGAPFRAERSLLPLGVAATGLAGGSLWKTMVSRCPARFIWWFLIGLGGVGATVGAVWGTGRSSGTAWWVWAIPVGALGAAAAVWSYQRRLPVEARSALTAVGIVVAADPSAADVRHVFEFRDVYGLSHRFPWRTPRSVRSGERCRGVYVPGPPVRIRAVKLARRR